MTTPNTPEQIAALAGRLSKAQRAAIRNACTTHPNVGGEPFVTVDFTDPWTVPVAQFLTRETDRLTPLGLRIRDHLIAMGEGE